MQSRYRAADATPFIEKYAPRWGEDLALRVYTSRLLGQSPELVLHGGGNTSVKTTITDFVGDATDVLYVKGSGWDLINIEPEGFPACRIGALRRLCEVPSMTDEQMTAQLRAQLIDPNSPAPSVETLLHAFLPGKFVDHTHADAVLSVVDQPDSAKLVRDVFGDRVLFVPYVMPGFVLARKVVDMWRAYMQKLGREPSAIILDKHGIFTWGETAADSYERMIAFVTRAERWLVDRAPDSRRTIASPSPDACERLAPVLRGALMRASGEPWIGTFRMSPQTLSFCDRDDLQEISQRGCATPDHVLRTKPKPLFLQLPNTEDKQAIKSAVDAGIAAYAQEYHSYFQRCSAMHPGERKELDPWPRVILIQGLGAFTAGKTRKDAEIAADIYEHTSVVIELATAFGGYEPASEIDLFDVEYWSLEQAKLAKKGASKPLDGRVAFVTGAASGIGLAITRVLLGAGAHVTLVDKNEDAIDRVADQLASAFGDRAFALPCDVTQPEEVRSAIRKAALRFGGLDLVVSNAGRPYEGAIHDEKGDHALRASLEVNLLGHQNVSRYAAELLIQQGAGGTLLFNASKSAFNQGPNFGPYAIPKAALIALMRQYAVDLAPYGIRANAVNADRIRTALFDGGMLETRARARGVGVDEYFRANLLRRETTANDVAQAFLYLATAEATTGCVITVDGGNASAFPR
ncbi:MAG TPA: bifunctional aldolase/short-chain dehydrogenase [Polyangium sp.]|nr:bifunctional aldolase/short-chain dehydrogenase [Polyangium sp.]